MTCLRVQNSKNIAGMDWGSLLWYCTKSLRDTCSMWLSLCHLLLRLQSLCSSEMKLSLGCLKRLTSTKEAGLDTLSWGELCSQETPCNCAQPMLGFVLLQWCVSMFQCNWVRAVRHVKVGDGTLIGRGCNYLAILRTQFACSQVFTCYFQKRTISARNCCVI